jgi:hypothetical protein
MPLMVTQEGRFWRRDFPQQSRRRAAVKISVYGLRMKVFCRLRRIRSQQQGAPLLGVYARNTRCFMRDSRAAGLLCFLKRTLRCCVGTTNALYKGFAGAKPAWCD